MSWWNRILSLLPAVRQTPVPVTVEQIRAMYGPPRTLGVSAEQREAVCMAMDGALADAGVYEVIRDGFDGADFWPRFMGYGALQNIAQDGLIRACVETVADDMTRAWIELKRQGEARDRNSTPTAELAELARAAEKARLQAVFHEAAELVGYEGGAFVFIDTGARPEDLAAPLNISPYSAELRKGAPLRFTVVDPVNVFPGDYDSLSPLSPHYFRPRWWWVLGRRVHASRLIRMVANEVPVLVRPAYNFFGIPQAQILWDYVRHFQECREASARLLTKFSLTVLKTDMQSVFQSGETLAKFDARLRFLARNRSNDGVLAVDRDSEDVIKLETPLSGVTDIVRQSLEILAAMNRTPAVKLLGISPSGFNATGESDIRNYYDHIGSQQEKVLRPGIQTALECLQLHVRGDIDPGLTFDFAPLGEEDRAALAMQQKTRADTIAVYLDRDVISVEEARKALADDPDSGFATIDPADVPEGNGMPDALPEGGEGGHVDIDDADRAGAVYDAALEDEDARTLDRIVSLIGREALDAAFREGDHPRNNDGKFAKGGGSGSTQTQTPQQKIDSIRIDFDRDNILPNLNPETLTELGKPDKPVLLKKNIIDRNDRKHSDVSREDAARMIGEALYRPLHVVKGNVAKDYTNFIGIDREKNCVVLLDMTETSDNFEVVHWHYTRPRS
ncbi:MAG: DUF1073 domain-containing protein, partial [Desulfovibrionaceae bacterium]|nr:DUF1073 domain-containing protein [Desulfovibrionaceae bacterium]